MMIIHDPSELPEDVAGTALMIGKFDGVHRGHRELAARLQRAAVEHGLLSLAVTFDRHPLELFAPEHAPKPVCSLQEKLELLAEAGFEATLVMPFTRELAAVEAEAFLRDILVAALRARIILVGEDFKFGNQGRGDIDMLAAHADELGYELMVTADQAGPGGRRASSTWVRQLLDEGNVGACAEVLGREHILEGIVVHGAQRGRELGFPTANLSPDLEGYIPADGVYAGWLDDGERVYPAAISVGDNPTFEGVPAKQVEAHVIDETLDLYDRRVRVAFVERLRGMERFDGLPALIARMHQDVDEARELLAKTPTPRVRASLAAQRQD